MLLIPAQIGLITRLIGREHVEKVLKGSYVCVFVPLSSSRLSLLTSPNKALCCFLSAGAAIVSASCPRLRASAVTQSLSEGAMGPDR